VRPASSNEKSFKEIPVLDVSRMYSPDLAEREKLALELRDAATRVGFMQIKNHGVPQDVIDAAFKHVKQFFDLPHEEKMKLTQHRNPYFLGYEPLYETNVSGLKRGGKTPNQYNTSFDFHHDMTMGSPETDVYIRGHEQIAKSRSLSHITRTTTELVPAKGCQPSSDESPSGQNPQLCRGIEKPWFAISKNCSLSLDDSSESSPWRCTCQRTISTTW
jgi:hypothetical protein